MSKFDDYPGKRYLFAGLFFVAGVLFLVAAVSGIKRRLSAVESAVDESKSIARPRWIELILYAMVAVIAFLLSAFLVFL